MSKTPTKPLIIPPTAEEDAAITTAALADPSAQPLTDEQLAAMVPYHTLRGRPKAETTKILLSVRYSPEVIHYFRHTLAGQARMDEVLQAYVASQTVPETN
ncbi:MAG: BrnA antitoxin family protein [Chloroflexi bacterium]|nr:BrnA antitoxin family protein [Chloroflexota bacterium]